jgi:hypothetical protein
VAASDQVFGHTNDRVGHAVDIRGERLGDDRDAHAPNVPATREQPATLGFRVGKIWPNSAR